MGLSPEPHGVDVPRVGTWLEAHGLEVEAPLRFERIAGGRSNLTFAVTDAAGHRWALRCPPPGPRLESAHDVAREFRIISALQGTDVPVPKAIGLSEEGENPFYVMGWVDGPILRSVDDATSFPDAADRCAIGERVVDALVAVHAVDPERVGLGDLARKSNYVARQLRRWKGQWDKQHTRELPLVGEVHDRLAARIPQQGPATIVHGDYRLDNVILTPAGEVAAVVDWELCTLGDPLADVGLLLVYWVEQGDALIPMMRPATIAPGFPDRQQVKNRYADRSGRDVSELDFYIALGQWKLAIIAEGVHARYRAGQYGRAHELDTRKFGDMAKLLVEAAADDLAG